MLQLQGCFEPHGRGKGVDYSSFDGDISNNNNNKMPPKTTRKEMSLVEKGMMVVLFWLNYSITAISVITKRPWSTVKNFKIRYLTRGHVNNLPRPGRPPKLSKRDKRAIRRAIKKDPKATRAHILKTCAPHVSSDTLYRYLQSLDMRKWLAKKRPRLTEERASKRLAWALERMNWTEEDFCGTLWSDECSVEKSDDAKQIWVFREPSQKWDTEMIHDKPKGKGVSLMVWGCFWGNTRGTFVPLVVKSVNAVVYKRLLSYCVLPVLEHIQIVTGKPARFQQDNAPVHKAEIIEKFFKKHKVVVDQHPPYSPDLNPIEHVWVHLKRLLHLRYPDISETKGKPDKVKQRLAEVLPLVWDEIPEELFENLWRSMPRRVAAVIQAKGWYTRY